MKRKKFATVWGWCEECDKECIVKVVDNGIGAYEFWGAPGNDVQLDVESECCNAGIYDDAGVEITLDDIPEPDYGV